MNTDYSYLDIAFSKPDADSRQIYYSYNAAPTTAIPFLSEAVSHFVNLTEGYLIWNADNRRAFSYFRLDEACGLPVLSITLRVDSDVLVPGRQIVNLLTALRLRMGDNEELTRQQLTDIIKEAGFMDEPMRCSSDTGMQSSGSAVVCRSYMSGSELANIFSFPRQADYRQYRGLIVVPATVSMQPENEMRMITKPLDRALMVVCPDGVEASSRQVELTDRLTLTYSRQGFDPVNVTFEVGNTNRYVRINGPALVVNPARHAGIIFRKRVPYSVKSSSGSALDTYTILVNGRTANRTGDGFEVSNMDFEQGKVNIAVSSTNFDNYAHDFTPEELAAAAPLDIVLEPQSRTVLLRLDFGGSRILEFSLTLEKNNPEYRQLRAGLFHGFRAHRLMVSDPETYNVDIKAGAEILGASSVSDRNAAASKSEPAPAAGPVAPVIEKVAVYEEPVKPRKAPEFARSEEDPEEETSTQRGKWVKMAVAVAVIAVAAVCAVWYFMPLSPEPQEIPGVDVAETVGDTIVPVASAQTDDAAQSSVAPVQPAAVSPEESADIAYLNDNKVWRRDSLKSAKYQALFEAISTGDIDAVVAHDYYVTSGRATNKIAVTLADYLWAAKGSYSEASNMKKLKAGVKDNAIDLWKLTDDLSRVRPSEPNTAPRPGVSK